MSMYGKNHYKYCKVISLQLIKIIGGKKRKKSSLYIPPENLMYAYTSLYRNIIL